MTKTKRDILSVFRFFSFIVVLWATPAVVFAAKLYFVPQEETIGTNGKFLVAINISAQKPVNAFEVAISVPSELTPVDTANGSSIVNFWVEKPRWDEISRLLTFAGIVPGGFAGGEATLLVVQFKAEKNGQAFLSFDGGRTSVYLHSPNGNKDSLDLATLNIPVAPGKENLPIEISDNNPPEPFTPFVARDPSVFGGKWFLAFSTQDKGSGVARYEINESRFVKGQKNGKPPLPPSDAEWIVAETPYLLKDQELRSYIFVKAVDKAGNERMEFVPPRQELSWREKYFVYVVKYAIIIIITIITIFIVWRRATTRKKHQKSL